MSLWFKGLQSYSLSKLESLVLKNKGISSKLDKAQLCNSFSYRNVLHLSLLEYVRPRTSYRNGHEGLLSFLELLSYCRFQNIIVISFEGLQKLSIFTNFGGCSSKIEPAMPVLILNFSRAWQSFFES